MKKLLLSKEIYSYENIQKVRSVYCGYGVIHVIPDKNNWLVLFSRCAYGEETTAREFENYLIGLENT